VPTEAVAVLRELARSFPIPEPGWHGYVEEMRACRRDLEDAAEAIDSDPVASAALERLTDGDGPADAGAPPAAVAAALDRLEALPVPEGEHPFLDEIVPTLQAARLALHAVAASREATERFVSRARARSS
jgi:hypothetical protein